MTFTAAIVLLMAGFFAGRLHKRSEVKKLENQVLQLEDMNGITWLKKK